MEVDLAADAVRSAVPLIDPVFRDTPQLADEFLATALGRELVVKVETLTPIGSFKGRGASMLVRELDPALTWVCQTAGNFGQALAYLARELGASIEVFVSPDVPAVKVKRMQELGAVVLVGENASGAAYAHAAASEDRLLVVDGLSPAMAAGNGTLGLELAAGGPLDAVVIQVGDGALAAGVACAVKSVQPRTRVVGVCADGAPAMAESFAAGRAVAVTGPGTIATAIAITEPVPAAVPRLLAYLDEIVTVGEDDLRRALRLVADSLGLLVEPAGAAGVAALLRHGDRIAAGRTAVVLTGSGAGHPFWNTV